MVKAFGESTKAAKVEGEGALLGGIEDEEVFPGVTENNDPKGCPG